MKDRHGRSHRHKATDKLTLAIDSMPDLGMPELAVFGVNSRKHSISVGFVEGALGIAFLPSTDGALDGVDVPQEKDLTLSLQRVTQSFLPHHFTVLSDPSDYAPDGAPALANDPGRPARTRFTRGTAPALSRTAMAQEERKAEGLNLVPVLLYVQQPCPPDQNANGTRNLTARGARAPAIAAAP